MVDSASEHTAAAARPRGLLSYAPELIDDIVAFQRVVFPERLPSLIAPRWRWMFEQSAARLGVSPMVWVYRASTGVVAHQGAIAVKCKVGDQTLVTGWFVETMVMESHRGRAVGPMLVKKALEDVPFNLSLGQTSQMRDMQFALGWVEVGPLPMASLALEASAVMKGKGNALTRPLAAVALAVRRGVGSALGDRGMHGHDVNEDVVFGPAHDALWARVAEQVSVGVVRDASFLQWKYHDQPGQQFVLVDVRRGGDLVGFVAFVMREPDRAYSYRRAVVTDILVPPTDRRALRASIAALRQAALRHGADLITIGLNQPAIQAELSRQGFLTRPADRVFLVAPGAADHPVRAWLGDPAQWWLSMSDSDIDRPC